MTVRINGAAGIVECKPGTWAIVERTWNPGDRVDVTIPLTLRMEAVDRQHPDRVAVMRGPVVLILEGAYHSGTFRLPERMRILQTWLVPEKWTRPLAILSPGSQPDPEARDTMSVFHVVPPGQEPRAFEVPALLRHGRRLPLLHVLRSEGSALQAVVITISLNFTLLQHSALSFSIAEALSHGERERRRVPSPTVGLVRTPKRARSNA